MEEKKALRKIFKAKRDSLSKRVPEYSSKICALCADLPEFKEASAVLLYFRKGSEADLSRLAEIAWKSGKTVGYPRCHKDGIMEFFAVSDFSILEKGSFGILEPKKDAPLCPLSDAICFVPALSFDTDGYRLGYGGGYYDRFLEGFSGKSAGITFEECLAEKLPRESFDKKTDYIITERRVKKTIED